jgi:thiamine biosynthesis protein ThiI
METTVVATLSGEIHLKSRRTKRRFQRVVSHNAAAALGIPAGRVQALGSNRLMVEGSVADSDLARLTRVFGIDHVERAVRVASGDLDDITPAVVDHWFDRTATGTFAVRVRRTGNQSWRSGDAERQIGTALDRPTNRVDLKHPDHFVAVRVEGDRTWITTDRLQGPKGLPVGTQEPVMTLLSGGFDSVVAAWMLLSRGCASEFVHFSLDCAQADHAVAVADGLANRWAPGLDPTVHLVDFQPIKDAIRSSVDARLRQVTLKVLMARTAAELARRREIGALVTGDSLGQVSSQTLTHLRAVDAESPLPILRPLLGLDKDEIIDRARRIGTAELSARAKEVCDLSDGLPVAVDAEPFRVALAAGTVDEALVGIAADTVTTFQLSEWFPGRFQVGGLAAG